MVRALGSDLSQSVVPAVSSLSIALLLYLLNQPIATVVLGALAVFPAVWVLLNQTGLSVSNVGSQGGQSLLEEEEAKALKKEQKKKKKVEAAKKKESEKEKEKESGTVTASSNHTSSTDSTEESGNDSDGNQVSGGADVKLTKTAQKKAKKAAAAQARRLAEEAELEAKRKQEELEKKKKKKQAKKESAGNAASASPNNTAAAAAIASESPSQSNKAKEELGWSVQKSDKPSSNKPSKSHSGSPANYNNNAAQTTTGSNNDNSKRGNDSHAGNGTRAQPAGSNLSNSRKGGSSSDQGVSASSVSDGSAGGGGEVCEEMYIPFKHHGSLIGQKAQTIIQLQTATSARIDMPKKDSGSTKVQISGSPEAVAAAKGAIESLISKGYSTFTHPGWVHDDLAVDEKYYGVIIGPKAQHLTAIQNKTNTRITVPREGQKNEKVLIVGKKEDVRAARQALKDLIKDGFSPLTHEGFIKKEVSFPKDKLHLLIGTKGQTIKSIQGNTKTKINIPDRASSSELVSVIGLAEGVSQAEKEIQRLLIPPEPVEPEEEYVNGTWSEAVPTEDELWQD